MEATDLQYIGRYKRGANSVLKKKIQLWRMIYNYVTCVGNNCDLCVNDFYTLRCSPLAQLFRDTNGTKLWVTPICVDSNPVGDHQHFSILIYNVSYICPSFRSICKSFIKIFITP